MNMKDELAVVQAECVRLKDELARVVARNSELTSEVGVSLHGGANCHERVCGIASDRSWMRASTRLNEFSMRSALEPHKKSLVLWLSAPI